MLNLSGFCKAKPLAAFPAQFSIWSVRSILLEQSRMLKGCVNFVLAFVFAFIAVLLTGAVFDAVNWSTFHTWGLMHGAIIFIFPFYYFWALLILWLYNRHTLPATDVEKKKTN
jgi:hypothetical protein